MKHFYIHVKHKYNLINYYCITSRIIRYNNIQNIKIVQKIYLKYRCVGKNTSILE